MPDQQSSFKGSPLLKGLKVDKLYAKDIATTIYLYGMSSGSRSVRHEQWVKGTGVREVGQGQYSQSSGSMAVGKGSEGKGRSHWTGAVGKTLGKGKRSRQRGILLVLNNYHEKQIKGAPRFFEIAYNS